MKITVQRDCRIAVEEHGDDIRFLDPADPIAIYQVFRARVAFEDGLTIRQLMKAIRPWKTIIGKAAWMDFDAWIESIERPALALVREIHDDDEPALEEVIIYCGLHLQRDDDQGALTMFESWDFHGRCVRPHDYGSGHLTDIVGLTFTDPRDFANIPVRIDCVPAIHDHDVGAPDGMRPILRDSMPNAYSHIELVPTFFDTIVLGLLDNMSFHGTPSSTDEVREGLVESVLEIKAMIADGDDDTKAGPGAEPEGEPDEDGENGFTLSEFPFEPGNRERWDASFALFHAVKAMPLDERLADTLGLTMIGLGELKEGITAQYSVKHIKALTEAILAATDALVSYDKAPEEDTATLGSP